VKVLNVLYQSNDNYAVITGVSMVSLLENNKDIDEINFYLLNDNISQENIAKLNEACETYGRKLTVINTDSILQRLKEELKVAPWQGTYTTYYKMLALRNLSFPTDRVLYLDGDTIITDSLSPLTELDLDGYIMAATYDCVMNEYKELIDIPATDYYYNVGVILFNHKAWVDENCEEKIIDHIRNNRSGYHTAEQDILNVLFRHKTKYLDITYNFNSGFYIYGVKESFEIYGQSSDHYDSYEKIKSVMSNPVIHHCMGGMTGRPWEENNIHPLSDMFDKYLAISPWKDYQKKEVKLNKVFAIQRGLYKILPKKIYMRMHRYSLKRYLKRRNKIAQNRGR